MTLPVQQTRDGFTAEQWRRRKTASPVFLDSSCCETHSADEELTGRRPISSRGSSGFVSLTYVCFHFVSYCCWHHDTTDDSHQHEVKRIHEASAGWLFDLGAAFAAQGTSSNTTAAGQLERKTKNTSHSITPFRFLLQKSVRKSVRLPVKHNFLSPLLSAE